MYLTGREVIINLLLDMREAQTTTRKIQALFKEDPYLKFIYKEEKSKIEIEEFLDGNLSPHEVKHFENKMKKDPDLIDEVNLRHKINLAIKDMILVKELDKVYYEFIQHENTDQYQLKSQNTKTIKLHQRGYMRWMAAASILILLCFSLSYYFVNRESLTKRLYTSYYEPLKENKSHSYLVNSSALYEAKKKYQEKDYYNALVIFNELPDNINIQLEKDFFIGLTLMEINSYDEAIHKFNSIINDQKFKYLPQTYWYLGLCYLKTNQKDKATETFNYIIKNSGYNSVQAEKILRKLK